jgi:hypothetical protein
VVRPEPEPLTKVLPDPVDVGIGKPRGAAEHARRAARLLPAEDAAVGGEPEPAPGVDEDSVDEVRRQPVGARERLHDLAALDRGRSPTRAAGPERAVAGHEEGTHLAAHGRSDAPSDAVLHQREALPRGPQREAAARENRYRADVLRRVFRQRHRRDAPPVVDERQPAARRDDDLAAGERRDVGDARVRKAVGNLERARGAVPREAHETRLPAREPEGPVAALGHSEEPRFGRNAVLVGIGEERRRCALGEAGVGTEPQHAFAVLEDRMDARAGEALAQTEGLEHVAPQPVRAPVHRADPRHTRGFGLGRETRHPAPGDGVVSDPLELQIQNQRAGGVPRPGGLKILPAGEQSLVHDRYEERAVGPRQQSAHRAFRQPADAHHLPGPAPRDEAESPARPHEKSLRPLGQALHLRPAEGGVTLERHRHAARGLEHHEPGVRSEIDLVPGSERDGRDQRVTGVLGKELPRVAGVARRAPVARGVDESLRVDGESVHGAAGKAALGVERLPAPAVVPRDPAGLGSHPEEAAGVLCDRRDLGLRKSVGGAIRAHREPGGVPVERGKQEKAARSAARFGRPAVLSPGPRPVSW